MMRKIGLKSLTLAFLMGFIACKKDEKTEEPPKQGIESSVVVGEWYRSYADYVEDITFTANLRFTGIVYENLSTTPKQADIISGSWGLSSYGSILNISIYRTSTGEEESKYYSVDDGSNYMLLLTDKEYGNREQYMRIVETLNLKVYSEGDIGFLKDNSISASGYNSSNPSIASVDSYGHVIANDKGVAFINVTTNYGTLIVKVDIT